MNLPFLKSRLGLVFSITLLYTSVGVSAAGVMQLEHIAKAAVARSQDIGRTPSSQMIHLSVGFANKNPAGLKEFIKQVNSSGSPLYGKFLTPAQYAEQFGASAQDYNQFVSSLKSMGFTVVSTYSNRRVVSVTAPSALIEKSFQVQMHNYVLDTGESFHCPVTEPVLSGGIWKDRVQAVVGICNPGHFTSSLVRSAAAPPKTNSGGEEADEAAYPGSGPVNGGLGPSDIKQAYGFNSLPAQISSGAAIIHSGAGQTVGLVEYSSYNPSDIQTYASQFGFTVPTLTNIYIDGATSTEADENDAVEATTDIEIMVGLIPGVSKFYIYQAPNSGSAFGDMLNKIADDNLAKVVSTSWGLTEDLLTTTNGGSALLQEENEALQQMAAQGQSFFSATGDNGAYADGSSLSLQDPSIQPYATAVGGTTLNLDAGGNWSSESSWGSASAVAAPGPSGGGGGGGISVTQTIPVWQVGLATPANLGSNSNRMVPDVSLDANLSVSPYAIYFSWSGSGSWYHAAGTSCAAPVWASFTVLANQMRAASSLPMLGFMNPSLYSIAQGSLYSSTFHDIADSTTNFYYPAKSGYDLSTGLGTIKGLNLFNALTGPAIIPATPTGLTVSSP
jgi:kumamolisin